MFSGLRDAIAEPEAQCVIRFDRNGADFATAAESNYLWLGVARDYRTPRTSLCMETNEDVRVDLLGRMLANRILRTFIAIAIFVRVVDVWYDAGAAFTMATRTVRGEGL